MHSEKSSHDLVFDNGMTFGYTFSRKKGITMPQVKTAISISEDLFEQVEQLAGKLEISRSRVFALAVAQFADRHENIEMLAAINAAHEEGEDRKEKRRRARMRAGHRKLVEGQW